MGQMSRLRTNAFLLGDEENPLCLHQMRTSSAPLHRQAAKNAFR